MASVRQQINIAATQKTVWRALTTQEGLCSWWADEARVESKDGGRVVLTSEGDDGEPVEERGMFVTFRPVRKVEIKWDMSSKAPTAGTTVTFVVARDGDETRVALTHSGSTELLEDEETRSQLDKEWKRALKALRSAMEG